MLTRILKYNLEVVVYKYDGLFNDEKGGFEN
jgi:hypothetical protein